MTVKKSNYFESRFENIEESTEYSINPAFPTNALIELTNGCNHKCVFCKNANQGRTTTYLKKETFEKFIKEASELGLREVGLYATGEPFMTKNLDEYISIAKKYNVSRVYVSTNGALADLETVVKCLEAGLNSIKFSINASNRSDYIKIHGHDDFDKVLKNVSEIYHWKKVNNPSLQMLGSCVVLPSKSHIIEEHKALFSEYFEDIVYSLCHSQGGQKFDIPLEKEMLNKIFYEQDEVNDSDISPCGMVFNRYHLTAEGYLTACCVDYNLNLAYSDLNVEDLKSGWLNSYITKLRQAHLEKNLENTICNQCLKNKKLPYSPIRSLTGKTHAVGKLAKSEKELLETIISIS